MNGSKHTLLPVNLLLRGEKYYDVGKMISSGAYGEVRIAIDQLGNEYAIKEEISEKLDEDDGINENTLREIGLLVRLGNHPNIVTPIDAYSKIIPELGTTLSIVMEKADGDLTSFYSDNKYMKAGIIKPLSSSSLKIVIYQCFRALAYMHSVNIWHRDIKTQNILYKKHISRIIVPLIADFGLAKIGAYKQHASTCCLYTLRYRPPEHLAEVTEYGSGGDIWSMGVVMLDLMKGDFFFNEESVENMIFRLNGLFKFKEGDLNNLPEFWKILKSDNKKRNRYNRSFTFEDLIKVYSVKWGQDAVDFIKKIMVPDPNKRISALDALNDPYFDEIRNIININIPAPFINSPSCAISHLENSPPFQRMITTNDRHTYILLLWILGVHNLYGEDFKGTENMKYDDRTYFMAVDLIYKCLENKSYETKDLQKIGITCYLIAHKVQNEEFQTWFGIKSATNITNDTYTRDEIREAEVEILDMLKYNISYTIASEYLQEFTSDLPSNITERAFEIAKLAYVSKTIVTTMTKYDIAKQSTILAQISIDKDSFKMQTRCFRITELDSTIYLMRQINSLAGYAANGIKANIIEYVDDFNKATNNILK